MDQQQLIETPFDYTITGRPAFSVLNLSLQPNQKVLADAGAMFWMDSTVDVETNCPQGCKGGCARSCVGESCCMNTFGGPRQGNISLGFKAPGDMLPFTVTPGNGWILSQKAFVAGTDNCIVSAGFPGLCACGLAGEGMFLVKVTTQDMKSPAVFFAGGYGEIIRHDIPEGKELMVENGLFFAAHESTRFRIGILGGLGTFCFGGEGFVMRFRGPAAVFTQSRDPRLFGARPDQLDSAQA
ncbi:unnamed protein product (mitochondrion) [Plasmodiophora brassicae]|uniref:Uncharacterized protein n=1 Tax=Plasmodiophora brassicae TaxID=37360 RepID=A0A3P3YD83_PLABS|nr:unnamed protein product [Plasmodiophora brassicae]